MVILGLGLDVVEVSRIARQLESPSADRFLARVFTPAERSYCEQYRDRANRYAARFAAKEAASKALGAPAGIAFLDVEVVRENGAPRLVLSGVAGESARALHVERVHLTLTHDGGFAAAVVILEGIR
jgi:holo-[acyl-carrier protein] synthase